MNKSKFILTGLMGAISMITLGCNKNGDASVLNISFGEKDNTGIQNIKKFDFFTSDWTWSGNTRASLDSDSLTFIPAATETKSQTMRTCTGMGDTYLGIGNNIGKNGKTGLTDAEYGPVLTVLKELENNKVQPYVSVSYSPECTLDSGNWKSAPNTIKYQQFMKNYETVMERNNLNPIIEILNEPDNTQFFTGRWSDYVDTYIAGHKGIRELNQDRFIVGPSVAWIKNVGTRIRTRTDLENRSMDDMSYYIERCHNEGTMPDGVSWHYYGQGGEIDVPGDDSLANYINIWRTICNSYKTSNPAIAEELKTVQTHINELNTFQPCATDLYQRSEYVPTLFNLMNAILHASDITYTNMAALVGEKTDGLSYEMINGLSYQRYSSYYAMWMYGHLPITKAKVNISDNDLISFAGVDDGRAGLILCNKTGEKKSLSMRFNDIPFETFDATAYLADDVHLTCSTSNTPYIYAREQHLTNGKQVNINLTLEPYGTVYFEFNNEDGTLTDLDYVQTVGKYNRADFLYEERGDDKPYSFFNQTSFTGLVGMGKENVGKTFASVLVDDVSRNTIQIDYETLGELASFGGACGFRIDYRSNDGRYKKAQLLTMADFTGKMDLPYGEDANPTKSSFPHTNKGTITVNLSEYAPADWNQSIRLTCFIKNIGANTSVKFRVK